MSLRKQHLSLLSLFFLLTTLLTTTVSSRPISCTLISDGLDNQSLSYHLESTCEQTYGFLPCTTTWLGNLFLIIVYGYLMFLAATYLSTGSELLLEILGPGIVGGLFLPILGALPDAMLILVSGLSGSKSTAQSQVSVGMGLLAGSTVMLITVIWGSCVVVGKCEIREDDGVAVDGTNPKGFSLIGRMVDVVFLLVALFCLEILFATVIDNRFVRLLVLSRP